MEPTRLVSHVCRSVANAYAESTTLPADIVALEGMSGRKTRHLYNSLCSIPGMRYLEVGSWKGSTLVSALYNNPECRAYCVDNWSEFGGPRGEFHAVVNAHLRNPQLTVLDKDCWTVTKADVPEPIDVFVYDGAHTYEDQRRAITHFAPFLAKHSVILVDDWMCHWADVQRGTLDGIHEAPLKVLLSIQIPLVGTNQYHAASDTFWNGCGIFVVERTDI